MFSQLRSESSRPPVRPRPSTATRLVGAMLMPAMLVVAGPSVAETDALSYSADSIERPSHRWLGPDQTPLPFASDEEILDFLATADVIRQKELSSGSTKPLKVLLEKNGVRANAVFRTVDVSKGQGIREFRDSYLFEVAAYEMSRLLGLDNVPPAVRRNFDRREGSMQLWVEGARSETDRIKRGDRAVSPSRVLFQKHVMRVFDHLIHNFDRNTGNILVDTSGKLWMIDHTRSFKPMPTFPADSEVSICERSLWQRLKTLDQRRLKERLAPHLSSLQLAALAKRHQKLVDHLERLIAEQGEEAVLYDMVA